MSTGNANLDSKLENPPTGPTPADKLREDMESLADRLSKLEEPADIDPKDLLPGAASSLSCLGMMYPEAGRVDVSFEFLPDITELAGMTWTVSATVQVYGELKATVDPKDVDSAPDMEDEFLHEITLEGNPYEDLGLATLSLVEQVRDLIQDETASRSGQVETLRASLNHIDSQGNLSGLWQTAPVIPSKPETSTIPLGSLLQPDPESQ